MEAPSAGLYWNEEEGNVFYVWGVRRDPFFVPDDGIERFCCHAAFFIFRTSGWGYWAVTQQFEYDMTREELAMYERLPVALPLIGKGPFSTAVRVAMEDMAALPRVDRETVSKYLTQMQPIGTLRLLRTWWRKTVAEWYANGPLPYRVASMLADIRMKGTLTPDDFADEEEEEEEDC